MSRGCIWALVGLGVTMIVLVFIVVAVPLFVFDIVTTASHVPVSSFAGPDTVIALSVEPRRSGIAEMWAEGAYQDPSAVEYVLPHELGMVIDVDSGLATRTMTFMVSPRHLGPVFQYFFGDPDFFTTSDSMHVEGIDSWDTQSVTEEKGALILRGHGAIAREDREFVRTHWAGGIRVPVTLEGSHFAELFIANGDGRGFLALANQGIGEGDETPEADGIVEEVAESPEDGTAATPEPPVSALDAVKTIRSLHATVDFEKPDAYRVRIAADCPDAEAALRAKEVLDALVESTVSGYRAEGVSITGDLEAVGNRASGELVVTGVRPLVVRTIREQSR